MYEYQAKILRVVDGDTVHLEVDLGLEISRRIKCRLNRINAPELTSDAGKAARDRLRVLLVEGATYTARTIKDRTEKYGRYLVEVVLMSGELVSDVMVKEGHAVYWDGQGPRPE